MGIINQPYFFRFLINQHTYIHFDDPDSYFIVDLLLKELAQKGTSSEAFFAWIN